MSTQSLSMSNPIAVTPGGSETSLPELTEKDVDPVTERDVHEVEKTDKPAISASGDRTLVLMDLDNGLVGWESDTDPDNPQ